MGNDTDLRSAAESIFASFLGQSDAGATPDIEALVAAHPEHASALRELWSCHRDAQGMNQRAFELPRPAAKPTLREEGPVKSLLRRLGERRDPSKRYERGPTLGKGGFGEVFSVRDTELERTLAMKVIRREHSTATAEGADPQVLARFLEEAQITGQLDHPGVVPIHEVGVTGDGQVYYTMRVVQGDNLHKVFDDLRAGRAGRTLTGCIDILARVCETMAFVHAKKGVIHRDLKPANVMVGEFGEVYVMDWGLARWLERDAPSTPATVSDEVRTVRRAELRQSPDAPVNSVGSPGTPEFMSPEQARNDRTAIGPQTDVYSVGAMLYQLLSGRVPYRREGARQATDVERLARVLAGPPEALDRVAPDTPAELIAICERAMERDLTQRYATMAELRDDLRAFIDRRVVRAYEAGAWAEARKWVVRNRALAASLAVAVIAVVVGAVAFAIKADQAEENARRADEEALVATTKANDVLSLSAQKDHDDLVAEAAKLWPAHPEMIPKYEDWLRRANELIDGRPADGAKGIKKRPSLAEHKAKLAELRADAKPLTEEETRAERESHSKYADLQAKQAELLWRSRMLGDEAWPNDAAIESELAEEHLPTDADALNELAWPLVDPAKPVYGQEVRASLLARRAVAAASEEKRAGIRDTLSWALFKLGRLEEALSEERTALSEPGGDALKSSAADLEKAVVAWRGDGLAQRRETRDALAAEVIALSNVVNERRTYEFDDSEKEWWDRQLVRLVSDLEALRDPRTGLMNDVLAEPFGWGVAKRYEFAKAIDERSVSGAEARRLWVEAIAAIRSSPKYSGLEIVPQVGLLPIGMDPDSKLWEFAHLQTGDPAVRDENGKLVLAEKTGLVFVLIPGGKFWMGAQNKPGAQNHDPQARSEEAPVHEVELSAYFLSKCEMMQGQWQRIAGRNPSYYSHEYYSPIWNLAKRSWSALHPVEQVSWPDCASMMQRLGLVLPTQAQSERGCRAGTATPFWSGELTGALAEVANVSDAYAKEHGGPFGAWESWDDGNTCHAEVGSYRANQFGLHDVHGNVAEWCRDGESDQHESVRPVDGEPLVVSRKRLYRGGTFDGTASYARSAYYNVTAPDSPAPYLGLRPSRPLRLSPSPLHPPK